MTNREDIIRMAREQGLPETDVEGVFRVNSDDLGRFAAALAAAEREACAQLCDRFGDRSMHPHECAAAIRARGNK